MRCSYCNIEMIHGYLNCGMTLWSDKKHHLSLAVDETEQYARQLGRPAMSPHHIESDCCPGCMRIIIDSSGYQNNMGQQ